MIASTGPGTSLPWLLSGADLNWRPERLASHLGRFGRLPHPGRALIDELQAAGLRGRGGAGFPTALKWGAVAERSRRGAVVVVNGAEGEPLSMKDRLLLSSRPHLVLDGAQLAASAVGARKVYLYVGRDQPTGLRSLGVALDERGGLDGASVEVVAAPPRFVAGEETAAVHLLSGGDAKPTGIPPRPFERGVGGRPTLINNVETLAHAALIARYGSTWFRSRGTSSTPGSMLITVGGNVARPGVHEVEATSRIAEVTEPPPGVGRGPILFGGYFGSWLGAAEAAELTFDAEQLAAHGLKVGAGVLFTLPPQACGVAATAQIVGYLAGESARQCGPCQFGLADVAQLLSVLAKGRGRSIQSGQLERWLDQLGGGRGACHHPDGTIGLVRSALAVFREDFEAHATRGACPGALGATGLSTTHPEPSVWR